jgi:methylase of polypeptide subunit release factors
VRNVHQPSLADALEQAAAQLARAGVANGRREATALWSAIAGVAPGETWIQRDSPASGPVAVRFWEAIEQRSRGVPFAYAVGRASSASSS